MKKIYFWEPWFFMVFGIFHLHRIWAIIDRPSYASFWMGLMEDKGASYFFLMGALMILCLLGIVTFFHEFKRNYWWRWIYLFGGSYLLFDLFAISREIEFWNRLLFWMFDIDSPYWNFVWGTFIILGGLVFALGVHLFRAQQKQSRSL